MVFAAVGLFVLAIVAALAYSHAKAYRLRSVDWQQLVTSLKDVPSAELTTIALDHLQPGNARSSSLDPADAWDLIGGLQGLRRLRHNAELLIELAAYVRRWNYDHAIIVSERIRHDSILLKRALFRIQCSMYLQRGRNRIPFYVCEAASSYYLMTQRILKLYEAHQYVLYPQLAEAL